MIKPSSARLMSRLGLGLLLAPALLAGCHPGKPQAGATPQPALTVRVQAVSAHHLPDTLALTGAIAAWQSITVSPEIGGLQVTGVLAEEGQRVHRGQLLVQLDDRLLQAQLRDARARVQTAQAQLRDAQYNYVRYKALRAQGGVTGPEMSQRTATVDTSAASLQQAEAAVAQDLVQISQTRVVAPTDGLVLQKSVLIGDVGAVGKAMFTLARADQLEMDGNVAEPDLPRLMLGQKAEVSSDAVPGLSTSGQIYQISPSLNASSRMATAKIRLPLNNRFKVGMFATATINLGEHDVLAVPTEAIANREGNNLVFVVGPDGIVHQHPVVTGSVSGDWTVVKQGLQSGDQVVIDGVGFLKEGDLVAIAPSTAPSGPGPQAAGQTAPPVAASNAPSAGPSPAELSHGATR